VPPRARSVVIIRPDRLRITRPPSDPPAADRTVTATSAPLGAGYTASDTGRLRARPTPWLRAPAVASTACGRPASRSTTRASGLVCSATADPRGGAASAAKTPLATGSPSTWSPVPSDTGRPVAIETTEIGLLAEAVGSPKSRSITTARSWSAKGSGSVTAVRLLSWTLAG
jgi:hypothetical protein